MPSSSGNPDSNTAAYKHVFCPWICRLLGAWVSLWCQRSAGSLAHSCAQWDNTNNFIGPGFMRETQRLIKKLGKCQKRAGAINSARRNDAAGGGGRRKRVYTLLINSSSTVVGRGRGGGGGGRGEREFAMWRGIFQKEKKKREGRRRPPDCFWVKITESCQMWSVRWVSGRRSLEPWRRAALKLIRIKTLRCRGSENGLPLGPLQIWWTEG